MDLNSEKLKILDQVRCHKITKIRLVVTYLKNDTLLNILAKVPISLQSSLISICLIPVYCRPTLKPIVKQAASQLLVKFNTEKMRF